MDSEGSQVVQLIIWYTSAILFLALSIFVLWRYFQNRSSREIAAAYPDVHDHGPTTSSNVVAFEKQIDDFLALGLSLHDDASIDDLLYSFPQEDYESDPYKLLLFMLGSEIEERPWGRFFSDQVWSLDFECVEEQGIYEDIVKRLVQLTGQPELLVSVRDDVDLDKPNAVVTYNLGGKEKTLEVLIDNDWADPNAVATIATDIETAIGDGRRFWGADNGQSVVLMFLTNAAAAKLNKLSAKIVAPFTG